MLSLLTLVALPVDELAGTADFFMGEADQWDSGGSSVGPMVGSVPLATMGLIATLRRARDAEVEVARLRALYEPN